MDRIKKILFLISTIFKSIFNRKKIFLLGIPSHGNLGDHAIAIAEEKFLNDNFPDYKVINLETSLVIKWNRIFKKIINKSVILYTGGGFLGSLWPNEEKMFEFILNNYKSNKIIALPQTIFFSDDKLGKSMLSNAKKVYSSNRNLTIISREKYTYDFIKKNFKKCNVVLAPDMVLYLDKYNCCNEKRDILFCIRKDKEKVNYDYDNIKNYLLKSNLGKIFYTDTVINKNISLKERNKYVNDKIKEFSNYKLVITDRLHGMIFSYLAGTPCLVLENKSYKILGVYEWIKDCNYINLCNEKNLIDSIEKIINEDTTYKFNKHEYENIKKIVEEVM